MKAPKENNYNEYCSQIVYVYSTFNLKMEKVNHDTLQTSLIYENEIEYSSEFDFSIIQNVFSKFKTVNDFFEFLNEQEKEYSFYISKLNNEYCILSLYSSTNLDLKLMNKDKRKNIEIYKKEKLLKYNVDKIIEMCEKNDNIRYNIILKDISYENGKNSYIFQFHNDDYYIIFLSIIQVIFHIEDEENREIKENIRTNYDINNLVEKNKINKEDVFLGNRQLKKVINNIDNYINNDKLELRVIINRIPEAKFGEKPLKENIDYKREQYSEYFSEYFENFNPLQKKKIFKFKNNELRQEIFHNIGVLRRENECKKYKITGPFSIGKSITLFVYSRFNNNVIYINLKTLKKNMKDYRKCLKIIFSECSRVKLNKAYFCVKISSLKVEENILNQLLYIIEIILDSAENNIILILDQFKSENIDYEKNFEKKIENLLLQRDNLRIVFCSSINDEEIRDQVIKTWNEYKGNNPEELNLRTQEYYFYYYKLFSRKKSKNLSYKLFYNKYKYIKKLEQDKNIDNIYNKIIGKLKKFHEHNNEIIRFNILNLSDVFIFLRKYINKTLDKSYFLQTITIIPLKYFCLDIMEKEYIIEPAFPFINYCMSRYINMNDCDEYFNKKKYLTISFLSNKVKGEYFEYAAIKALQNSEIIKLPYKYKNIKEVTVNEIVKMDTFETSFDDMIKEFSKNLDINKNDNEYEDNEEEEEEEKDEENDEIIQEEEEKEIMEDDDEYENIENQENDIFIDKNDKININLIQEFEEEKIGNKIEKVISKYLLKDFVNTFNKNNEENQYIKEYEYLINEEEKKYIKRIKDYKSEIYEREIKIRKDKILNKVKEEINKRKINEQNGKNKHIRKKKILKIPIYEKNKKKNKKDSQKEEYDGNETFYITQSNPNGELLDYAVLYGNREQKIFLGFQIKCYSSDTDIGDKFTEKDLIKQILSPILLNSIKLFNCLIQHWHYYLIYYYSIDDNCTQNVGYKTQLSTFEKKIEYLLYDPSQKVFYSKDIKSEISELKLTYDSNLDSISYLNECSNYLGLPVSFYDQETMNKFYEILGNGLNKFVNDFKIYSTDPKNILSTLSEILGIKNLTFCFSFHFPRIEIPLFDQLLFYKKVNSPHFIAFFFDKNIRIYDLETRKSLLDFKDFQKAVDFEYEYTYILRFKGPSRKRIGSNEFINLNLIKPSEKSKE